MNNSFNNTRSPRHATNAEPRDGAVTNQRTILVTGASGFLGSRIAAQVAKRKQPVRTTGRSQVSRDQLPGYVQRDLTNEPLDDLVDGTSCVIHSAGLAHRHRKTSNDGDMFHDVNVEATERLAIAAANAGVEHFVLISSVSVYGECPPQPVTEDTQCYPTTPYAISKWEAEQRLKDVCKQSGMRATILRMATLYGEGDPGNVGRLMSAIDRGRFIWIGTGANQKSLLHGDDAAAAVLLAAAREAGSQVECYNVADKPVFMRDVVRGLADALGTKVPRMRIPAGLVRGGLRAATWFTPIKKKATAWKSTIDKWLSDDVLDATRFQQAFGFVSKTELREGLRRQVAEYRLSANKTVSEIQEAA